MHLGAFFRKAATESRTDGLKSRWQLEDQKISDCSAPSCLTGAVWYDDDTSTFRMRWNTSIAWFANHFSRLCVVVCVTVGLLMSCSPTLLYRHADRLLLWKIDEYVDLTSDQKRMVRDQIKALLARHRKEALPLYERFLIEVKDKSSDGLDRQEVDWMFSTYQQFRTDLFGRVMRGSY
jgi:hypothetical protein